MSTPHPIKSRQEKSRPDTAKKVTLHRSLSMPVNLDKLRRRKRITSFFGMSHNKRLGLEYSYIINLQFLCDFDKSVVRSETVTNTVTWLVIIIIILDKTIPATRLLIIKYNIKCLQ